MGTKALIIAIALAYCAKGLAQLSIEDCHEKARANYPLINQYGLIDKSEQFSLANIAKSYLPQLSLNGQASYQSDVTKIPIDFASLDLPTDIPSMGKDQYKATIDLSQTIWDGGNAHSRKQMARATSEVERKRLDVSLYAIEDRVNQLFFGILAIDEELKVLDMKEADIRSNKDMAESMLRNGRALQTDIDQLDVELLNIDQARMERLSDKKSYCKMLSLFIHEPVRENMDLRKPDRVALGSGGVRPELSFYDSQIAFYETKNSAIKAKNMPRLSLFAQGGYGRPGFDMLEDRFRFFAMAGLKLTWNFGNLYTKKSEKRLLEVNKSEVEVQRQAFILKKHLQLTQDSSEMEKYDQLLSRDDEIIELRAKVRKASESMYRNGAYKTNELMRDINAEQQARQSKALHEIQYLLGNYNYIHTQGN